MRERASQIEPPTRVPRQASPSEIDELVLHLIGLVRVPRAAQAARRQRSRTRSAQRRDRQVALACGVRKVGSGCPQAFALGGRKS
jgi:hypothetical protein